MNTSVYNATFSLFGFGLGTTIFLLFLICSILIMFVLEYIFSSMAFYNFMKNRNLDNAFLAWIPIVNAYAVGKVYDDINEKQGKQTNFAIILLIINCVGLTLITFILKLVCYDIIFKEYTPSNSNYFILTVIFSIIPLAPFIPGLCLLKASKNQPVSQIK